MARVDVTQTEVCERLRTRLIEKLGLNPQTCYFVEDPFEPGKNLPGGDCVATIHVGEGDFDPDLQRGGGTHQLTERQAFTVSLWIRTRADQQGHVERALFDPERGVLARWKPKLLSAIASWDLSLDGGDTCLREHVLVLSCSPLRWQENLKVWSLMLQFALEWDWDLTDAA